MSMLKICPSCGKVISYNSHFSAYVCDCGYELAIPRLVQRNGDDIRRVCHFDVQQCDMGCYGCVKRTECNHNLFDKLSAYEDAEENGYLIRFPCKPGDNVFFIYHCFNKVGNCTVTNVKFDYSKNQFVINGKCEDGDEVIVSTVFKSYENAEREMKKGKKK